MGRVRLWALLVGIGLCCAACGGSATSNGQDAATDGGPPHDVGPPGDGATDGPAGDAGGDAGTPHKPPFMSETAGGATVSSANYRVTVFVAPTVPVGAAQSMNYRVGLGPGAIANGR